MNQNVGVLVLAAVIAVVGVLQYTKAPVVVEEGLGAFSGPELTDVVKTKGLVQSGLFTISTTASAMTLKDSDLKNAKVIKTTALGAGQAALALTLPASTTWPSLPESGATQSWVIDNTDVAAATTTTITAGTGVDIDGTTANDDVINGAATGRLECWRLPTTGDIRCIVEEMVDAG